MRGFAFARLFVRKFDYFLFAFTRLSVRKFEFFFALAKICVRKYEIVCLGQALCSKIRFLGFIVFLLLMHLYIYQTSFYSNIVPTYFTHKLFKLILLSELFKLILLTHFLNLFITSLFFYIILHTKFSSLRFLLKISSQCSKLFILFKSLRSV